MKPKLIVTFAALSIFSTCALSAGLEMPKTNYKAQEEKASPEVKAKLKKLREQIRASGKKMGVGATEPMFLPEGNLFGVTSEKIDPKALKIKQSAWDEITHLIEEMRINEHCPEPITNRRY